jgi:RimJ/RimL family protein N-acetyltransferase
MSVVLDIASNRHRPALRVKPWLAADMPDLLAAMALEYPQRRLWSHPDLEVPGKYRWSGPRNDEEAGLWLSGQERGWDRGDWLTFAVVDAAQHRPLGHVGLKNRDGGLVGSGGRAEISYWTAADARGRGIAPAAVQVVTDWAFSSFGTDRLPAIMLVHDVGNPASCRVAEKSGYPFHEFTRQSAVLVHRRPHPLGRSGYPHSERDRVPGQAAVPGQQQLSELVAVVRMSVDHHAIADGGESQVVPALAAVGVGDRGPPGLAVVR